MRKRLNVMNTALFACVKCRFPDGSRSFHLLADRNEGLGDGWHGPPSTRSGSRHRHEREGAELSNARTTRLTTDLAPGTSVITMGCAINALSSWSTRRLALESRASRLAGFAKSRDESAGVKAPRRRGWSLVGRVILNTEAEERPASNRAAAPRRDRFSRRAGTSRERWITNSAAGTLTNVLDRPENAIQLAGQRRHWQCDEHLIPTPMPRASPPSDNHSQQRDGFAPTRANPTSRVRSLTINDITP